MTTIASSGPQQQKRGTFSKRFNWDNFLIDNITGSRGLTIWIMVLCLATLSSVVSYLGSAPARTLIITIVWAVSVVLMVLAELFTFHNPVTRWMKDNLYKSVSNTVLTLLIALVVSSVLAGLYNWGVTTATFSPELTGTDVRPDGVGASWGVIWGARKLLLTGLLKPEHTWRVILFTAMVAVLWALTFISSRQGLKEKVPAFNKSVGYLWLLAPFASFIFLAGIPYVEPFIDVGTIITGVIAVTALMGLLWFFKVIKLSPVTIAMWVLAWPIAYLVWRFIASTEIFPQINVDDWGGLLLTVIFAIFVNILSLPIGILLALGRRAEVFGIPLWIVWPVAILGTVYFLLTSTLGVGSLEGGLWETSRNSFERLIALWPLLIIAFAWYFQRSFEGNVVQAFSVLFIEIIRGVPLITLLFMAIVMSPFFSSSGEGVKSFWAVIVGFTIFSSAYMAELVRGGLQAIPRGQYEAADALGFNILQKYRFIVMPQALRILIPPLAGSVIGTFKSSSLVALVGMVDLVGITRAIIGNPSWLGLRTELYAFMFVLYFLVSSVVSWYSRRLEERTGLGVR